MNVIELLLGHEPSFTRYLAEDIPSFHSKELSRTLTSLMGVVRVVLLIDASHETAAELSHCVCDTLLKPVLDRLEMLHEGSDLRLAIVSYSFPSNPDGRDPSVTQGSFESFGDSYSTLRNKPMSVGLGRLSNLMGDSMALIDGFIQALKVSKALCTIIRIVDMGVSFVMERFPPPTVQFIRYSISSSSLLIPLRLRVTRLVCPANLIPLCGSRCLLHSNKYDVVSGCTVI